MNKAHVPKIHYMRFLDRSTERGDSNQLYVLGSESRGFVSWLIRVRSNQFPFRWLWQRVSGDQIQPMVNHLMLLHFMDGEPGMLWEATSQKDTCPALLIEPQAPIAGVRAVSAQCRIHEILSAGGKVYARRVLRAWCNGSYEPGLEDEKINAALRRLGELHGTPYPKGAELVRVAAAAVDWLELSKLFHRGGKIRHHRGIFCSHLGAMALRAMGVLTGTENELNDLVNEVTPQDFFQEVESYRNRIDGIHMEWGWFLGGTVELVLNGEDWEEDA